MLANVRRLWRICFDLPELNFRAFALLVVTNHESPEQIVEWFVFESILRRGDAKRNVIRTRKRPRVTNPARQKRDDRRRRCRSPAAARDNQKRLPCQTAAVAGEHLCDAAVCAIRADQKRARSTLIRCRLSRRQPDICSLNFSCRDLFRNDVRAGITRAVAQVTIKSDARIDRKRLIQLEVKFLLEGEYRSSSLMVRPTAFSNCGHAFKAFAVTPPPQAFGSPSGRPSNSATFAPPFASNSAAKEPPGRRRQSTDQSASFICVSVA